MDNSNNKTANKKYVYVLPDGSLECDWRVFVDKMSDSNLEGVVEYQRGEAEQLSHKGLFCVDSLIEDMRQGAGVDVGEENYDAVYNYLNELEDSDFDANGDALLLRAKLKNMVEAFLDEHCANPELYRAINRQVLSFDVSEIRKMEGYPKEPD